MILNRNHVAICISSYSILIGKSDKFYKIHNFSDEEIKLIREQESSNVFDYKKIILDRFDEEIKEAQGVLGIDAVPSNVAKLLDCVEVGYDANLPICLLVDKVENSTEFCVMCEAFARNNNMMHLLGKGYSVEQLDAILDFKIYDIDLEKIIDNKYYPKQIKVIGEWVRNGLDPQPILNSSITASTMSKLGSLLLAGININQFWDTEKWNVSQLQAILDCVCEGTPIHRYVSPEHNEGQIVAICNAMAVDIPLELVSDTEFDDDTINTLVEFVKEGFTVEQLKPLFNTKYDEWQVRELVKGIKDDLDISKFSDWRLDARTMCNLRLITLEEKQGLEPGYLSTDVDNYEEYDYCDDCDYYY